ncbi:MAG: RNA polymerase factor sigma-54 [Planctomycetia bacterium]
MRMDVGLHLRQSLQLRLAPQIIQSIEILQLPTMDLRNLIEDALQENEALEVVEEAADALGPAPAESRADEGEGDEDEGAGLDPDAERTLERLEGLAEAEASGPGTTSRAAAQEAADRKLEALQNAPDHGTGLADHLMLQVEELELAPEVRRAAEAIIFNLDAAGLLRATLEDVREGMDEPVPLEVLQRGLDVVQGLEPRGVGARDATECLLLQVDEADPDAELKRALVRDHLADLQRNKMPKVAKALGIALEDLYQLKQSLARTMTLRPGAAWSAEPARYIRPDILVEWQDGDYVVRLVQDALPRLGISPQVRALLREARGDPRLREHLKKKVDLAKWLIDAIAQRQGTLERVAREIVSRQREYLEFGVSHLKPLKMQEVADALGIHVSTVSRAISEKHMQEPRGITPLKFFFTGGTENGEGGVESRQSVKERVREIIEHEDKKAPKSDDEVAEQLSKESGLEIARRTVTKYRKALGIPSSRQRRIW